MSSSLSTTAGLSSVRLLGLRKTFGEVRAVDGIDLDVSPGEFVVLLGPSGCGKSTLLRLVAGLERPTAGRIRIGDQDVTGLSPKDRDVAMVFQNYALYPHMTVESNLGFGLAVRGTAKAEIADRVREIARALDLKEVLGRRPAELSGGQRQRVAMGRAMVRRPRAFLMDEPLSNLDTQLRVALRGELARLRQRLSTTTLYVTHDQVEAMTLGDRVAILRDGAVEQCDTPQRTFSDPANLFVATFIGAPAMNLFEATIANGCVHMGEANVPVRNQRLEGRRVIAGVRPGAFESDGFADPMLPRIDITCEVVEELGSESYVLFQLPVRGPDHRNSAGLPVLGTHETHLLAADPDKMVFTARVTLTPDTRPGNRIRLAVDPRAFYFFDPTTGAALPRGQFAEAITVAARPTVGATSTLPGDAKPLPDRLKTPRLILRRWGLEDRHSMVAIWRDPDVWRSLQPGLPFDPHRGEREFELQLRHWSDYGFGLWAVDDLASGQVIGWIGPTHPSFVPELAHEVELGWTLRREFWGRGFATEGARAALSAVFTHTSPSHVISIIHPQNRRSSAVARRLGMTHDKDVVDPSIHQRVGVWKLTYASWIQGRDAVLVGAERSKSTLPD
jgi:multiple sugar transport system ATP-binding protein